MTSAAMNPEMERRRAGTVKTKDRYLGKAFDWSRGVTCVHLARAHLRNMGHRPPSVPRFRSALAARRALAERGWSGVPAMLDAILVRIPPARMALGDLVAVEGDAAGLEAIMVCTGGTTALGWHESEPGAVICRLDMAQVVGVWRG